MKISYTIINGPKSSIIDPIVVSEIDGTLRIDVENDIIFDEEDILLLEFAIYIKKWLKSYKDSDFIYESMEFEEKPILSFEKVKDNLWKINSVWFSQDQTDIYVAQLELINACTKFITDFSSEFKGITFQY
ncbi:hypothetical protein D7V64_09805 [Acinetobacter cumulans]|uniref:DUF7878 domain-containing protein n=1 Tax=Acinetobacter cumulans TaxID=2136182 RepID=A0A3A8FZQ5_9GAMM|nr:hypothetical protein [Acinetobacter cumulans]RKG52357.1 hypothetical protein D7V64_09805 [Acinetobacter cumulans]